jgi:hypothetical protein
MGAVPKAGDEGRLTCASVLSLDPPVRLEQAEQARNVAEGRNVGHARRQPLLDRRPLCPLCSRLSKVVSHELRSTRPLREGTLREHSCGHARPLAVSRRRSFSGVCGWFVSVDSLACPRFPPLCSMVRRGSTVRVRQRASRKCLQIRRLSCPGRKRLSRAGTRGHSLMFPRYVQRQTGFGLFRRIRSAGDPLYTEQAEFDPEFNPSCATSASTAPSRRQTAMSLAVGPGLYPRPSNAREGGHP